VTNNSVEKVIVSVFGLIGLAFLVVVSILGGRFYRITQTYVKIEATVSYIDYEEEEMSFTYRVQGVNYILNVSYYSSLAEEGDSYDVYYNPENPYDAYLVANQMILVYVFGGLGLTFTTVSLLILITKAALQNRKKRCMAEGRRIRAKVIEFRYAYVNMNNKQGYRLICEANYLGTPYTFKSHIVYYHYDIPKNAKVVSVYIIHPKKYYVDIDSISDSDEFAWFEDKF
jgi:hypothetical protein